MNSNKKKVAEKAAEILARKKLNTIINLSLLTVEEILLVADAFEEAKRIVAKEEALELTQRFAHELPGIVDWPDTG